MKAVTFIISLTTLAALLSLFFVPYTKVLIPTSTIYVSLAAFENEIGTFLQQHYVETEDKEEKPQATPEKKRVPAR